MIDIKIIADEADMIVNGYAFKRCKEGYRVLNLNRPDRATVLSLDGKVLETNLGGNVFRFFFLSSELSFQFKYNKKRPKILWSEFLAS